MQESVMDIYTKCGNYKISIFYDEMPPNPFEDYDCWNGVKFAHKHKRYFLGGKDSDEELNLTYSECLSLKELEGLLELMEKKEELLIKNDNLSNEEIAELEEEIENNYGGYGYYDITDDVELVKSLLENQHLASHLYATHFIYIKDVYYCELYIYDHSGVSFSSGPFHCPWDSGQIGFAYIDKKTLEKDYLSSDKTYSEEEKEKIAKDILEGAIKELDAYSRGECYGAVSYKKEVYVNKNDPKDEKEEWNEKDSCWGFLGYDLNDKDSLKIIIDHVTPELNLEWDI